MVEPPHPFGNAAARWFYVLLRGLVERGHSVVAFAACSNAEHRKSAQSYFSSPEYDLRCYDFPQRSGLSSKLGTLRQPYSYMFSPEMRNDFNEELARGYDVLHLEQLWSGWLGWDNPERSLVSVHYLSSLDLKGVPASSLKDRVSRYLMQSAEVKLLEHYQTFRSCSEEIARGIRKINANAQVTVSPFGIDSSLYSYIPDNARASQPVILLIGSMHWYPSLSAARRLLTRLWPMILDRMPEARVQIVGWGAKEALAGFEGTRGVEIFENVPEIRPYFERASLLLYPPLQGSGMKIKVLEAMCFGVPVVTTPDGVEGLPAIDGKHAGISDSDQGLVDRALTLLADPKLQNQQRAAARSLVERHCAPTEVIRAQELQYATMGVSRPQAVAI